MDLMLKLTSYCGPDRQSLQTRFGPRNGLCRTLLDLVCWLCTGHKAVVSHLLDAGADAIITVGGQTAVDIARAFDQTDILNLLTEHSNSQPKLRR